ncbi:MAG: flippase [Candidatus Omnitrophota bacterium]
MSQARRIFKNFTILFACRIFVRIFSFILVILIARLLGAVGMGRYSFVFSYVTLFTIFADFGINEMLIREIAKDKEHARAYVGSAFLVKGILSSAVLLLLVLSVRFFEIPEGSYWAIAFWGMASLLSTLSGILISLFRAYERMEYEAAFQILSTLLAALLGLAALLMGYGITGIFLMYFVSHVFSFCFAVFLSFKTILKVRILWEDFYRMGPLLRLALPFAWGAIFVAIYCRVDTVMLQFLRSEAEVGWYGAPYRLIEVFLFIPGAFSMAVYPVMSRYYRESKEKWHRLYQYSLKVMFVSGLPIALGTVLIAPQLIPLLFGGQFLKSIPALQILVWRSFLAFLTGGVFASVIPSSYTVHYYNAFAFVAALINISLNALLIPRYGYLGCCVAAVATELVVLASVFFIFVRILRQKASLRILGRPFLAGMVMFAAGWAVRSFPLYGILLVTAAVYTISVFALKVFTQDELEFLKSVFGKKFSGKSDILAR